MGIQGLLPFLKKASHTASIKEFKGCTVAIDTYCWLHRGAFACAEKLALGEKTDQYVYYCMKYINSLLSFGIRPIMVFDGCRLPSKKEVERARRERRDMNRKKAAQLLREGKRSEARDCLAQCIDVTPHMALELMNACREKGVDCIVAPYEADAQLAYLNKIGLAEVVITEDSDLILFGCEKIMFKMDIAGNGILIEKNDLNNALQLPLDVFTFDKFRYICILSGCDYLPSLPGIGLAKASKLFRLSRQNDLKQVIRRMPSILKMSNLVVPEEYVDSFFRANNTFLYQLVYDPLQRKLLPLNPYSDGMDPKDLQYAGPYMDEEEALQIALGNTNINTGEKIADFDPAVCKIKKTSSWSHNASQVHTQSIWSIGVDPLVFQGTKVRPDIGEFERLSTKGKEVVIKGPVFKKKQGTVLKHAKQVPEEEEIGDHELMKMYSEPSERNISSTQYEEDKLIPLTHSPISKQADSPTKKRLTVKEDDNLEVNTRLRNDEQTYCASSANSLLMEVSNMDNDTCLSNSFDTKELPQSPGKICMQGKENSPDLEERTLLSCNRQKRRNVFAVDGKASKHPRFSLNAPKLDSPVINVKSRFFTASLPGKETTFFQELKKGHNNDDAQPDSLQDLSVQSLDEEEVKDKEQDRRKDNENEVFSQNYSKTDEAKITNPHKNFEFDSLAVFRSNFDRKQKDTCGALPETIPISKRMISVLHNPLKELPSSSSYSTSSQSPNRNPRSLGVPENDDSDCLVEDPIDHFARHLYPNKCEDTAIEKVELLRTVSMKNELPNNGLFKKFISSRQLSLDSMPKPLFAENETSDVLDSQSSKRLSLDCDEREMSESPTGKSSTAVFQSRGCRASGLLKTKAKGQKNSTTEKSKQSAISHFFHSTFALDKKSVAKIAPSVKNSSQEQKI